jgi:anaerobic selenocysteine-containing dehydrogenase
MKDNKKPPLTRRDFLSRSGSAGIVTALAGAGTLSVFAASAQETPLVAAAAKPPIDTIKGPASEMAIPTFCAMCGPSYGCGINAIVRDGKFIRVEGRKDAPLNRGKLCAKAHAAPQWVYSPQRLKYPMRRVGKRGKGKFEKISWDQALDLIADKLKEQKKRYGPESLAILSPAHRTYSTYLYRFLTAHGSPNYGHSGICAIQKAFAFSYTVGTHPAPDIENTKLYVIWAKQPVYAGSSKGGVRSLIAAKERGVKIVAIKPTMEPDVAHSDLWIPIRPGTDAAFALALLHVVIEEKLYDTDFVEKWTYGFDRLVPHVRKYSPEWAEPITGIPAQQARDFARLYATTKPACIEVGNGLEHAVSCNDAVRAIAILSAITGNLDRKGGDLLNGNFFGGGGGGSSFTLSERYTQEWVEKIVGPEFPKAFQPGFEGTSTAYYRVFESVLTGKPYPIRTIIAPGTQPTVSTRGTANVLAALKKVDFFVVIDVTRTAEIDYADVVIPVTTMYETDHPFEGFGPAVAARNKVIEPLGDYKSDYEFWIDLGVRMGYGKDFWNGSIEACMDEQLKPMGITYAELRQRKQGFAPPRKPPVYENYAQAFTAHSTRLDKGPYLPEGKVAIYNTTFEKLGFNPLPEWREPPESPTATPELLSKYPLTFSDFHTSKVYNAAWLRNVAYLREVMPDPTLQIHPETAAERGIVSGDAVVVESLHGSITLKADVNPGIRPDTVMALHGWWQGCAELGKTNLPVLEGGANTNSMYSTDPKRAYDPLVTAMTSQTLVQVRKA